jgi:asparagine synthase (glutamine-hydrolysing)
MLRSAFENDNLLPNKVLWRCKEAFSDGVTSETRSWHKIIQEYVDTQISDEYFEANKDKYIHNTPVLKESFYYREIFEKHYGGFSNVIPYFWMPKWCEETNDPSAREI